jgi:hypothetical protein
VIDSFCNLIFRCSHKRTSFPLRPPTKAGQPPGDMCVTCLDCGKRFHYDWELMRIGGPVEDAAVEDVATPKPANRKSKLRYLLAALALPVVWLIGKTAMARTHSKQEKKPL